MFPVPDSVGKIANESRPVRELRMYYPSGPYPNLVQNRVVEVWAMILSEFRGKVSIALHRYSVRRAHMGSTEAARLAGRKQARIAAANRTSATEMNAEKSSACTPKSMLCMARPTK